MTVRLPDSYVGGPIADADPRETIQERFDGTQRNFDAIARLMIDTGGVSIGLRFGTAVVATPGAAAFFDTVIDHGLGTIPVVAVATPDHGSYHAAVLTFTDTQFTVRCSHTQATSTDPGDFNVYWIALG